MTTKRHRKKMGRELPPVGTTLQGRFKGETRTATIVDAQNAPAGKAVECEGGRYESLNASARPIIRPAVNGRTFWRDADAGEPETQAAEQA